MADFLPTLAVFLIFGAVLNRYMPRFSAEERGLLWVGYLAHQFAGAANIWIAKYYYGYGDMLTYHRDGEIIAAGLRSDFLDLAPRVIELMFLSSSEPLPLPIAPMNTSSATMQGISGFCMFFLFDSLYATCAVIAAIGFFSKIALYSVVRAELPELPRRPLLWSCALIPSVVFWTTSLLKEPIAMAGLLFGLFGWHRFLSGARPVRSLALAAVGAGVVLLLKGYILSVLCISIGVWMVARRFNQQSQDVVLSLGQITLISTAAVIVIAVTGALLPSFALAALTDQLAGNQAAGATIEGGSNYSLGVESGSAGAQLALAPLGLLTALFRPMVFEARNSLMAANALEMAVFSLATLWVPFRRGIPASFTLVLQRPFLSFCTVFVVVFGTFVGLGSTNLGTLSRYRAPLVPFFAILLLALLTRPRNARDASVVFSAVPGGLGIRSPGS